jgi:hypothetical protein
MSHGTGYHGDTFTDYEPERHTPRCEHCGGDVWLTTDGDGRLVSECSNCRLYARVRTRRNAPLTPNKGASTQHGPRKRTR